MTNRVNDIEEHLSTIKVLLLKSSDSKTRIEQIKKEGFKLVLYKHSFYIRDDDTLKEKINETASSLECEIKKIIEKYNGEEYYNTDKFKEDFFNHLREGGYAV